MNSCSTGVGAPPLVSERQTESQFFTCAANSSGIEASTPIRARTSPERLVSCVCVTSRLRGKRAARSALPRWKSRTDTLNRPGSPPTSFKASSRA